MSGVHDFNGAELTEGAHVEAWQDGIPYTATVKKIRPPEDSSGYRRVILVRDDDGTETPSFSDLIAVIEVEGI